MTKFYTADLHHKHKNICKITDRNLVVDQEHHDEWLIDVWNTQVKRGDLIYILGDISFSHNVDEIGDWLSKLNGQKIVIKGNHDRNNILEELCIRNVIQNWFSYHEVKIGSTKTCMMHFPIACWNQQGRGSYHIHGHSHGSYKANGKILDVGLDNAYNLFGEHRLFTEEDIIEYMSKQEVYASDHHKIIKEN